MAKDIEDVIEAIEDALDAATALRGKDTEEAAGKRAAIDAINKIRRGDYADAITTLEREFLPKWSDRTDCAADYRNVMAEPKEWR